jgi:LPS-assembly lipoprotein
MQIKRRAFCTLALVTTVTLSGCGFQLRGSNHEANLPFKTIYVGIPDTSPFGAELKRYIRASGTEVVTDQKAAQAILEVLAEARDKGNISLNTQGRIREYTLYYRLTFQVKDNQNKQLLAPTQIVLNRNISFNEAQVIAKEQEEVLLYRDMQSDMVQQILRRLAVLKPAA